MILPDQSASLPAILFFGSGRWAKILLQATLSILDDNTPIVIVTARNSNGITHWLHDQGLTDRVTVVAKPSEWKTSVKAAVIVNAANDHYDAAMWCIMNRIPVLVEKPICSNYTDVQRLYAAAISERVMLCPANVFLFAEYLYVFKKELPAKVNAIDIYWTDPIGEHRYGEVKTYDPSLPIYTDWMPHIISLLTIILSSITDIKLKSVQLERGGAFLKVSVLVNDVNCEILMERNSNARCRQVNVAGNDGKIYKMDFSSEPGIINAHGINKSADLEWKDKPRPTVRMISAFLNQIATFPESDSRLAMELAMIASNLSQEIAVTYIEKRNSWLASKLSSEQEFSADMQYACSEIISIERRWKLAEALQILSNGFYRQSWNTASVVDEIHTFLNKNFI